ncbi:hypothetical protein KAU33_08780 [Candidatus Dependentiae bacterium]|nr:hypothetical protein [Candidatus Dependentiae bacterium]
MKRVITKFEAFVIIICSFAGLILLNAGLNLVIPFEKIDPYLMVILGTLIIMITGAYALKKK